MQEIFESAQVARVNYEKVPNFEPKDKTTLGSSEVVTYLKALILERKFFTFGDFAARQQRLCQRLHRFLRSNLAPYMQKCAPELKDPEVVSDPKETEHFQPLDLSEIVGQWVDFEGRKSELFYALGGEDVEALPKQ